VRDIRWFAGCRPRGPEQYGWIRSTQVCDFTVANHRANFDCYTCWTCGGRSLASSDKSFRPNHRIAVLVRLHDGVDKVLVGELPQPVSGG
jgi:hypothetical protein